jgi:hypothetical protein
MQNPILIPLGVLVIIIVALIFSNMRANRKAVNTLDSMDKLKADLEPLRKYQVIADADADASRIRNEATETAARTRHDANQYAREVQTKADNEIQILTKEAREKARESKAKSQQMVEAAIQESKRIIDSSNDRAREIAGNAIDARDKAKEYEKAARAMKNIINGYGDEYVIPNRSVLDDLAEDFEHKEAGAELKKARAHTKGLVKNGLAATCDYVEESRKTTATRFVLDAFNGKSDTVLAKVKHDNYGKLQQEIEDAFSLVNGNGRSFRNARIEPDYLKARLDELKWAVAANVLKLEEREEQRLIREHIREEERARREYEKAKKEAEKEERMLQIAMKEARVQLESASQEQKAEFERQLAELGVKLAEAEAKGQRAMSMAQQTRTGHVYVISNVGSFGEDVFKIGLTRRLEPLDRVKELGDASVPFEFDVHAMLHSTDAPTLENELHKVFHDDQVNKVNSRKEFFRVSLSRIREKVEELEIEAHWTMKAEAREYRESLAFAQSFDNPNPTEGVAQ